jgi:hypothetical protein
MKDQGSSPRIAGAAISQASSTFHHVGDCQQGAFESALTYFAEC